MASPSWPPQNLAVSAGARDPEMGDPEMEDAHREMVSAPLPPPEEGRVENILFCFVCWQPVVPKTSVKERFPQSLGLKRRTVHHGIPSSSFAYIKPAMQFTLPSHVATRPPPPLWSQKHLRLLYAIHILGMFNQVANELS